MQSSLDLHQLQSQYQLPNDVIPDSQQQYESVMQLMHQDLQRLMQDNQQLTAALLMQQNEQHQQSLMNTQRSISVASQQQQTEEISELRRQVWEANKEVDKLQRELKHSRSVNEDLEGELQQSRVKREEIDSMLQDAKTTICQQMIQARHLQTAIDQHGLEVAGLNSQIRREAALAEQAVAEAQRLRALLEESDVYKVQQMQILDQKEREVQALRAVIRRLMNVITTHREAFGELADLNYELMFKDVSNMNLQYQPSSVAHSSFLSQLLNQTSQHRVPHDFHKDFSLENNNTFNPPSFSKPTSNQPDDYQAIMDRFNNINKQQTINRGPQQSVRQSIQQLPVDMLQNMQQYSNENMGKVAQKMPQPPPQPQKKAVNVEGLKITLNTLMEEKRTLEEKIARTSSQSVKEDYQFELEVTTSNIKHVQEKLQKAGAVYP